MRPAQRRLAPELRALTTQDPTVPVVANVDADLKRTGASSIDALIAQVSSPVQWEGVVTRLASEGVNAYVEVGPGTALSGMVRKIHPKAAVSAFGSPDDLAAVEALRVS
jgi:[acyl-carrier-protein] S-malonyltransferase